MVRIKPKIKLRVRQANNDQLARGFLHGWKPFQFSNELVYQYQIPGRNSKDVLEADRERLRLLQQPVMLNHQLMQLYTEMEAEQRNGIDLALEDSENSISSRDTDETNHRRRELRRRSNEFRRTMLYEENAPFPHPESSSTDG